jgi:hypothetical protein
MPKILYASVNTVAARWSVVGRSWQFVDPGPGEGEGQLELDNFCLVIYQPSNSRSPNFVALRTARHQMAIACVKARVDIVQASWIVDERSLVLLRTLS